MKIIQGVQEWTDVTLLEDGEALTGGEDGKANLQAKALVNRTAWLKEKMIQQVNGKVADEENRIEIEAKDILSNSGETVQKELDGKSDEGHSHRLLDQVPDVSIENAGKSLIVSQSGEKCEWQMIGGVPVGTIIAWAGENPPIGYLECNGASLSRIAYKGLFEAIGTIWGSNDEETFKLPDFYGAARFLRSRSAIKPVGRSENDEILSHSHSTNSRYGDVYHTVVGGPTRIFTGHQLNVSNGNLNISSTGTTGGEENRPKSAVVMYCIKAVDEYINPSQIEMDEVAEQIALKPNRNEVKEYAGTRLWVSDGIQPILNQATVVEHGLSIDPIHCKSDLLLICKESEHGYEVGEMAKGLYSLIHNGAGYLCASPIPMLTDKTISYSTGNHSTGLLGLAKTSGTHVGFSLAKWRYVFRIWY